jgi:hypothetical protein
MFKIEAEPGADDVGTSPRKSRARLAFMVSVPIVILATALSF